MLKAVAALTGKPLGGPSSLGGANLIPGVNKALWQVHTVKSRHNKVGKAVLQCNTVTLRMRVGRTAGSSLKGITGMIPPSACGHFASSMMSSLAHRYYALRIDTEARRV